MTPFFWSYSTSSKDVNAKYTSVLTESTIFFSFHTLEEVLHEIPSETNFPTI